MKKFLLALVAVLGLSGAACARDVYSRDASSLPLAAQEVVTRNFKGKVSVIKIDKELGFVSDYEVVLTNGAEIQFDRNGNWESIEMPVNKSVPNGLVPKGVNQFVRENHKGLKIVGLERDRRGYEVQLSNGVEMKFDRQGNFQRYDD